MACPLPPRSGRSARRSASRPRRIAACSFKTDHPVASQISAQRSLVMEMLMERRPSPSLASDGAWLLLAELNHRVCNELQVAMSALRLAKRELASDDPARFIEEAELRLEAFGYVHQLLDRQRDQGSISQRLEALC